jgi:hypothetical protein
MKVKLTLAMVLLAATAFAGHLLLFIASTYSWVSNGLGLKGLLGIIQLCISPALGLLCNVIAVQKLTRNYIFLSSLFSFMSAILSIIVILKQAGFFFPWIYSYLFLQIALAGLINFRLVDRGRLSL